MRIDKHRQLVNVGDVMSQKRVNFNLADQARARLSDYIAEVRDEQCHMAACGSRGVGDEIENYPVGYAGFPVAFTAPDAAHLVIGDGQTKATLTDTLSASIVDRCIVRAKKMFAVEGAKGPRMEPISPVDGQKAFVFLTSPESMYDLRHEVGDAGWLTLEKAKAAAVGAKSPIFQGGDAFYNGVVITESQTCVKFNDYGAGGTTGAVRNLFLGAHAVAVADGMRGQRGGVRYEMSESDLDHGEEQVIVMRMITAFAKTVYNNFDFGVQSVDTAYTPIN
jgi:N4-gp56 family major capsid protein